MFAMDIFGDNVTNYPTNVKKLERKITSILAEGAIALSVTLSGGALFAS